MAVILMNGPPQSGKDKGAWLLRSSILNNCSHLKFAQPLKAAIHSLLGLSYEQIKLMDQKKDEVLPWTAPLTPRQMYIDMSEEFTKPRLGPAVFGYIALNKLRRKANMNIVVSDCGFDDEVIAFTSAKPKGNVYCISLAREGCSYENDSRNYLKDETLRRLDGHVRIDNNYEEEFYEAQLRRACVKWGLDVRTSN